MILRFLTTGRHDEDVIRTTYKRAKDSDRFTTGRDVLVVVGDRIEAAKAAVDATGRRMPIVHLHGGEVTAGAYDDQLRHAITKLSHLHLVSHVDHAARVIAMGEDPATVHVVGAPGIDNMHELRSDWLVREPLEKMLGVELKPPVIIVTLHPATLGEDPKLAYGAVNAAMGEVDATYIVTLPNRDPGHEHMRDWRPRLGTVVAELGWMAYWALMYQADAMLGNSSSGLIEAPAVQLPVVNVGDRQKGRLRGKNVIDAPPDAEAVTVALRQALSPDFRADLKGTSSPYGDGHSAERIVEILANWTPPDPPRKRLTC